MFVFRARGVITACRRCPRARTRSPPTRPPTRPRHTHLALDVERVRQLVLVLQQPVEQRLELRRRRARRHVQLRACARVARRGREQAHGGGVDTRVVIVCKHTPARGRARRVVWWARRHGRSPRALSSPRVLGLPAHAPSSDSNWMITLLASSASSRRCLAGGSPIAAASVAWGRAARRACAASVRLSAASRCLEREIARCAYLDCY